MKYTYPAIFTHTDGGYLVRFPDFSECVTFGDDLIDATEMAEDVLCLHLYNLEKKSADICEPTIIGAIKVCDGETVAEVSCDTHDYQTFLKAHK